MVKKNYSAPCTLEVELFPIYQRGNWTIEGFRTALQETRKFSPEIVNISWNTLYRNPYDLVVRELKELSRSRFLVAASGQVLGIDDVHTLSDTVMGNVPDALVIGALSKNGYLASDNVRGELLTALPAPHGTLGSSFSAAFFTAKLAETLCRNKEFDLHVLSANKRSSLQEYPGLEELLRN